MIDNYDSFTYNLVQYLGELGSDVRAVRNDRASVDELLDGGYERCVDLARAVHARSGRHLAGGRRGGCPRRASRRSGCVWATRRWRRRSGARWCCTSRSTARRRRSSTTDGRSSRGWGRRLTVGRYHSLVVDPELPDCLEESARGGGVLMALRHRELPAEGVQFHPESVLTRRGQAAVGELPRAPDSMLTSRRGQMSASEVPEEFLSDEDVGRCLTRS